MELSTTTMSVMRSTTLTKTTLSPTRTIFLLTMYQETTTEILANMEMTPNSNRLFKPVWATSHQTAEAIQQMWIDKDRIIAGATIMTFPSMWCRRALLMILSFRGLFRNPLKAVGELEILADLVECQKPTEPGTIKTFRKLLKWARRKDEGESEKYNIWIYKLI